MIIPVIQLKNGLVANKHLNKLADKLDKLYKNSKNIKRGFDMGFDGQWEYVIKNTKTNKGIVLKQHPQNSNQQVAFVYLRAIDTLPNVEAQLSEDAIYRIDNQILKNEVQNLISKISK